MITNPILTKTKNFVFYLFFLLLLTVMYFALLYWGMNLDPKEAVIDSFVSNFLLFGLGLSFWYSARYISFETTKVSTIIISHLIGGIISSVLWIYLSHLIMLWLTDNQQQHLLFFNSSLPWRFMVGLMFYYMITSFYYVIIYYTNYQSRIEKENELKNLVTEAELRSLKFQINPHFIFNSLNSMSALTVIDPDKARGMILKLADFLRFTLANNEKQKNKLSDELKNIKLYLEIEKIRFEEKFDYEEDITNDCLEITVPNMLLQPLFENAIKHAVYETLNKVLLKLHCEKIDGFMKIVLENNYEDSFVNKKGTGTGLKNISSRLELFYNMDNLLEVKKDDNTFKVILYIPLNNSL
jgi:two-component system, LytTR family, sensor kinase